LIAVMQPRVATTAPFFPQMPMRMPMGMRRPGAGLFADARFAVK
jgi:hypothetical protein